MGKLFQWIRQLYDWVKGLADGPYGPWALFLIALAESSFFPVPPDVLLIALAVGRPKKSLRFAAVCTAGSLIGAGFGYWIGSQFFDLIGRRIVDFYGLEAQFENVRTLYREWDVWAVGIAGFTPIPYKVFTIAAGVFDLPLVPFFLASTVGRAGRFFLVGALIYRFGPKIQAFIERHLGWLSIAFAVLVIGGFVFIRYVIN